MKHSFRSFKILLLCAVMGYPAAANTVRAAEHKSLLGANLATVEKSSDLFTFFHLGRMDSKDLPDRRTLVSFKTTAEAFRPLMTLLVTIDAAGVIESMRLEVARSFIDDSKQGVFAADLVKSFLMDASGAGAEDDIGKLALEISTRAATRFGGTVIAAQSAPVLPKPPSAGYQTYVDKGAGQTLSNRADSVHASISNEGQADKRTLVVEIGPKGR